MKVAFVLGQFPSLSQLFILNQITGLVDRGHEVDIYALEGPSHQQSSHPQVQQYDLLQRTVYAVKTPEALLPRLTAAGAILAKGLWQSPLLTVRSLNVVQHGKKAASLRLLFAVAPFTEPRTYDIIHCQFGTYALLGLELIKMGALSGKLITSFRGYDISSYPKRCGADVYTELFAEGDFFLANCEFFRKKAIALGCDPKKISVLGSGIDCSKFAFQPRSMPADGAVKVLTIGRLVEKKGIEYAIRAIAQLTPTYPNLEFQIIGDGELRPSLETLINDLGQTQHIKLLGWKSQPEIIQILEQAHLFIAPSVTSQAGDQDAPVNTLKEAMAMGLPVISTWHGGIPELVEDGISGYLVPERDAASIADQLAKLLRQSEQWAQMGQAGHNFVEKKYNMGALNDQLVQIYGQLLDR